METEVSQRPGDGSAPAASGPNGATDPAVHELARLLEALDPRDRELLELSMRRRVPDDVLARVYSMDQEELARRRAAVIRRLSDQLGVRRGRELGRLLNSLLDYEAWRAVEVPDPPRRRLGGELGQRIALAAAGTALLVALMGLIVAWDAGLDASADRDGVSPREPDRARGDDRRWFVPRTGTLGAPFPSTPSGTYGRLTAEVRKPTTLYTRPGGGRQVRIGERTTWGSRRIFPVLRQEGGWLGVIAPELRNGQLGWLPAGAVDLGSVHHSLRADLSRRQLAVLRDGRVVRRMRMTVGASSTPTPRGRFAVTDRLLVRDPRSPYGRHVLALSAHQSRLPRGWPGGDRVAIHASRSAREIGSAASYGCLRVHPDQARWLVDHVPLGSLITISS